MIFSLYYYATLKVLQTQVSTCSFRASEFKNRSSAKLRWVLRKRKASDL